MSPIVVHGDLIDLDFGIDKDLDRPDDPSGAHAYRTVIVEEGDLDLIRTEAHLSVDREETDRRYQRLAELYDGLLQVEQRGKDFFWFSPMDRFIQWRGIEQMFVDLSERPQWVHDALERSTAGYLSTIEGLEALVRIHLGMRD